MKVANVNDIATKAQALSNELREKDKEIERLNGELVSQVSKNFDVVEVGSIELVANGQIDKSTDIRLLAEAIRDEKSNRVVILASINKEKGTATFVCACGKDAVSAGAHAGNIVREVAKIAGGNGGGKPDFAQAGGKDITKVDDAVMASDEIVKSMLK